MSRYSRREEDVGITDVLGGHSRFTAKVKQRFSDFHVNEIDPCGNVVKLTSLSPPVDNRVITALDDQDIISLVPEDARESVTALQQRLSSQEDPSKKGKPSPIEINVTLLDKESRTKIHKWVASFDKLSSETVDADVANSANKNKEKLIRIIPNKGNQRFRRPANRAKYTHCLMYKEGVETSEAIGFIAKKLNLKPGLISYAGIKDKRAKTCQRISISNIEASRLVGISKYSRNIKLGNFEYNPRPINLGELKGNHFKLVLKDFKLSKKETGGESAESALEEAMDSFKTKGFINYYGLQRFGSYRVSTNEIGKCILQQNWLKAFDLILHPKDNDQPLMKLAKERWLTSRDVEGAIRLLPKRHRSIESHLLHGLLRFYSKNDFVNVFTHMPRNVRLLYVHAYQSFLWNRVASYRIKEYGLHPVVGDLVYVESVENADDFLDQGDNIDVIEDVDVDSSFLNEIDTPTNAVSNSNQNSGGGLNFKPKLEVKTLTEDDLQQGNGKYSIYSVLIPLYGSDVKKPKNKTKEYLDKILEEEGIDPDCFLKFRPVADKPTGAYRKLVVLPKNVSHKIVSYSDSDPVDKLDTLVKSDWDLLQEEMSSDNPNVDVNTEVAASDKIERKKTCVVLEFSLPSASYATMALREFLQDTDNDTHDPVPQVSESSEPESVDPKVNEDTQADPCPDEPVGKKSRLE